MERVCQFFRTNYILANCEDALVKKAFSLNLSHYQMTEIPDIVEQCETLLKLFLNQNLLTKLPNNLGNLARLQVLTLDYNKLDELPICICRLTRLRFLNISCNNIKRLPPEMGHLTVLKTFWCNNTGLEELPVEMKNCERLETLGVRGNPLQKLPDSLGYLGELRWFTAEGCQLTEVPSTFALLTNLVHLNLKGNCLRCIPSLLQVLPKLRFVFLNNNRIDEMPTRAELEVLQDLNMLNLCKNPISLKEELQQLARQQSNIYVDDVTRFTEVSEAIRSETNINNREEQEQIDDAAREGAAGYHNDSSDWENSVRTSELDTTDESGLENNIEDVSVMLPEMSRYVTTF